MREAMSITPATTDSPAFSTRVDLLSQNKPFLPYFCQAFGHSDRKTQRADCSLPYRLLLETLSGYLEKVSTLWGLVVEWKEMKSMRLYGIFWSNPSVCSEVEALGYISW